MSLNSNAQGSLASCTELWRAVLPLGPRVISAIFLPEQRPDRHTMLRTIFALGNTPSMFNKLLPRSTEITPEIRAKYIRYTQPHKRFILPILPTVQVYHHVPVNGEGGVESGD